MTSRKLSTINQLAYQMLKVLEENMIIDGPRRSELLAKADRILRESRNK